MNGGAGDDTLVWNNGDGSDVMNGDAGVDRVENNLGAGDDVSTLKNENGRVRYDRTNAGPFNLSIATAEVFELNTLGGDDSLTTTPTSRSARRRRRRRQRHAQGGGTDTLDGGDGDDVLDARRLADFVAAAPAPTRRRRRAVDAVAADVESVDRPAGRQPAPAPAAGAATIAKTAKVKKGVASLSSPARPAPAAATAPSRCSRPRRSRPASSRPALLGRQSYTLKAGETKTIKVKLATGTAKLAKKKKLAVTARVVSQGADERPRRSRCSF